MSRTTISNYLTVLEATYIVNVIRPFSTHRPTEIVSAPKVYGFDTGFVCYYRGWYDLRQDDLGYLFEHLVLNELHAHLQTRKIQYWRDKQGHEIDFIILKKGNPCAIEWKWSSEEFDPSNLKVFRRRYPEGENYVVCWDVQRTYTKAFGEILVRFVSIEGLVKRLLSQRKVD